MPFEQETAYLDPLEVINNSQNTVIFEEAVNLGKFPSISIHKLFEDDIGRTGQLTIHFNIGVRYR